MKSYPCIRAFCYKKTRCNLQFCNVIQEQKHHLHDILLFSFFFFFCATAASSVSIQALLWLSNTPLKLKPFQSICLCTQNNNNAVISIKPNYHPSLSQGYYFSTCPILFAIYNMSVRWLCCNNTIGLPVAWQQKCFIIEFFGKTLSSHC